MIRVGCGCGFFGDRIDAAAKLLEQEPLLDYVVFDYLAEYTMGILAAQKEKDPRLGYAKDFLSALALLPSHSGVKFVTNAGGCHPEALAQEIRTRFNPPYPIGVVKATEPVVYLGADPIVELLQQGAGMVITGRVADPSLTLACCMDAFSWETLEKKAIGTVAGHLLECGAQVTGGLSDRWLDLERVEEIGYPIALITEEGGLKITKTKESGGEVSCQSVWEQLFYEVQDPFHMITPDVTLDLRDVAVTLVEKDCVEVTGIVGLPPTATYKASKVEKVGFFAEATLGLVGERLPEKAKKMQEVIEKRIGHPELNVSHSLIGFQAFSPLKSVEPKETLVRFRATSKEYAPVKAFTYELAPLITTGPQGVCAYMQGRAKVLPLFAHSYELIPKNQIQPELVWV